MSWNATCIAPSSASSNRSHRGRRRNAALPILVRSPRPPATDVHIEPRGGRREPNGAFVEDVIAAAMDRIEFYEASQFACDENKAALKHLDAALAVLDSRTKDREARDVEGTHER